LHALAPKVHLKIIFIQEFTLTLKIIRLRDILIAQYATFFLKIQLFKEILR
jgi:hypothetical protein